MITRDERDDSRLMATLRAGRQTVLALGPSRLELERRKFMAKVIELNLQRYPLRVWKKVFVGSLLSSTTVAVIAVFVFFVGGMESETNVHDVSLAGVWQLDQNDAIAKGTPVRVPKDGKATLVLTDGTMIWMGANTVISVSKSDGSKIKLKSGHLVIKVKPRDKNSQFEVITSDAAIRVFGTFFSITVENENTIVRLHEGSVSLTSHNHTVMMQTGHRIITSNKGILSMEVFDETERAEDLKLSELELESKHNVLVAKGNVFLDETSTTFETQKNNDETEIKHRKINAYSQASVKDSERSGVDVFSKRKIVRNLWKARRFAEIITITENVGLDANLLFYRAKALSRLDKWFLAAESFAAVAGMNPSRRSEALYLSANAYNRSRNFERGLDMAEMTIGEGGTNADHAWRLKIGALSGLGKYKSAADASAEYLVKYPFGAHVADALFSRGTGLRLSKQWANAFSAYKDFIGKKTGSESMRDDATFYLAYCMLKIGQIAPGNVAMQQYVEKYPNGRHGKQARALLAN